MTPDRMVVDEARRTFTYLNLYGYLTDAVVVNRVFPEEVGDYFGAWRERQQRAARRGPVAPSRPCPCCARRTSSEEVVGADDARPPRRARRSTERDPARRPARTASRRSSCVGADAAELRMDLPFAEKGDISLKKIGLELVVRVDGHKRTLMLPPALGDYRPTGASFDDGALHVTFDGPGLTRSPSCASASTPRRPRPSAWRARRATTRQSCPDRESARRARRPGGAPARAARARAARAPAAGLGGHPPGPAPPARGHRLLGRAPRRPAPGGGRGRRTSRSPEERSRGSDTPMTSAAPRRIVTGHDASGRSVVLSDAPTPKTLDIGTAAFHELWITAQTPAEIAATEPEPTDRPVRTPPPADGVVVRGHRDGARRRVADAPHRDRRRRRRARGRDVAPARRRIRDAGGRRRRGRPARHEPRVGEPIRSSRADALRADRRHDRPGAAGGRRAARVLRSGPATRAAAPGSSPPSGPRPAPGRSAPRSARRPTRPSARSRRGRRRRGRRGRR